MSTFDKIVLNGTEYDLGGNVDELLESGTPVASANLIDPSNFRNLGYYYSTSDGVTTTESSAYSVTENMIDVGDEGIIMYVIYTRAFPLSLDALCYNDSGEYLGTGSVSLTNPTSVPKTLILKAYTTKVRLQINSTYANIGEYICLSREKYDEFVAYGSTSSQVIKDAYMGADRYINTYMENVSDSNNLVDPNNLKTWGWNYGSYNGQKVIVTTHPENYQATKEPIIIESGAVTLFARVNEPLSSSLYSATILCYDANDSYLGACTAIALNETDELTRTLKDDTAYIHIAIGASATTFNSANLCLSYTSLDEFEAYGTSLKIKEQYLPSDTQKVFSNRGTLYQKNIVFFGDSIIAGSNVVRYVGQNTGAHVYNAGIGGTSMSLRSPEGNDIYTRWCTMVNYADCIASGDWTDTINGISSASGTNATKALQDVNYLSQLDWSTDVDMCVIMHGANDDAVDSSDPTATSTYGGAIRHVIETLLTAYPNLRLVFCTVVWRSTEDDTKCTILESACAEYNIQCINNRKTLGINSLTASQYMADNVHPNELGKTLMANHISHELW